MVKNVHAFKTHLLPIQIRHGLFGYSSPTASFSISVSIILGSLTVYICDGAVGVFEAPTLRRPFMFGSLSVACVVPVVFVRHIYPIKKAGRASLCMLRWVFVSR